MGGRTPEKATKRRVEASERAGEGAEPREKNFFTTRNGPAPGLPLLSVCLSTRLQASVHMIYARDM